MKLPPVEDPEVQEALERGAVATVSAASAKPTLVGEKPGFAPYGAKPVPALSVEGYRRRCRRVLWAMAKAVDPEASQFGVFGRGPGI